jgi:hypothetical protein
VGFNVRNAKGKVPKEEIIPSLVVSVNTLMYMYMYQQLMVEGLWYGPLNNVPRVLSLLRDFDFHTSRKISMVLPGTVRHKYVALDVV